MRSQIRPKTVKDKLSHGQRSKKQRIYLIYILHFQTSVRIYAIFGLDASLKSYKRALRLDVEHIGANEYIGELYLTLDKPKKAKKHLKRLQRYCGECEEMQELAEAIEAYEKAQ